MVRRTTLGRHFIEWYISEIDEVIKADPDRVFEVVKVDFHDPLQSIIHLYREHPLIVQNNS